MRKIILILIIGTSLGSCKNSKKVDNRIELAKSYYQILDSGNAESLDSLASSSLIDHDGHSENAVEEIKGLIQSLGSGFDNLNHEIEQLHLIDNDKVFVRWRMTGVHIGEFFGSPASQKKVNFAGHDLMRFQNDKMVEIWHVENLLGMMGQISETEQ